MRKLIISTGNAGKVREFKEILQGWEVSSMKEEGIMVSVEETGTTFEENARIKAKALAEELLRRGIEAIAIADDSGLEIDAFGGGPGVYSARYLGEDTPYTVKNRIILDRLANEIKRSARYACSVVAIMPDGQECHGWGTVEGEIGYEPKGEGGFGYDPIFFVPEYHKSMAELTPEEKNSVSHRGKALLNVQKQLENMN